VLICAGAVEEVTDLHPKLRAGSPDDAVECGRICYEAFATLAAAHSFPCDFPSAEVATELVSMMLSDPGFYGVVAEIDGRVVGSNFLDERNAVVGVGPITVDSSVQDSTVGRELMLAVMDRAAESEAPGVRLVQTAYHNRSLALYAKLGFEIREPLACMQGPPVGVTVDGYAVRSAAGADLDDCNRVCRAVHGHDRAGEVRDALDQGTVVVVEHSGRVSGYSTGLAFFGHSVGETDEDIKALIGAADQFSGPGILVPTRDGALFRWCLEHRLRVVQVMTLMSTGLYNEPAGSYLPSIQY
jgi:predicted N-acetyltransferase YhbS